MMAARHLLRRNESLISPIFRLCQMHNVGPRAMTYSNQTSPKKKEEPFNDEPVPFSSSKAADFNSLEHLMKQGRSNRPEYEPLIIKLSLITFLIYFCVLREESDWDTGLGGSLFDTVPDLEIVMLRAKRKNASLPGAERFTEADRLRLEELEKNMK